MGLVFLKCFPPKRGGCTRNASGVAKKELADFDRNIARRSRYLLVVDITNLGIRPTGLTVFDAGTSYATYRYQVSFMCEHFPCCVAFCDTLT